MNTGDGDADGARPARTADALPKAPLKWPTGKEWLAIIGLPLVLDYLFWMLGRDILSAVITGKSATLTYVGQCIEGGGHTGPPPSCYGRWEFADGSTRSGTIHSSSVDYGDTVFASADRAYSSLGSAWSVAGPLYAIMITPVVMSAVIWVNHYRQDRRERTRQLRNPPADEPGTETGPTDGPGSPEERDEEAAADERETG
ncbi:hypothetical protein ACH4E9_11810 [Streptomyces anulatus]|uniref:hypothetical protein n=1 Tax=Streptomyces anulatus TaxID=1892 RepID=UPI00225B8564|nr:hypothetical protein [Streptomyces anulatus]MCX4501626.1 hypothetical protein [Streptomyces anulatus]